jgi:tryptophan-rich hypothetical protein
MPAAAPLRRLSPAKLDRSKWTALAPLNKEKHFMVVGVVEPVPPGPVVEVTMEAVHSGRQFVLPWRALCDTATWAQGWA